MPRAKSNAPKVRGLWELVNGQPVVLHLIRRYGCGICRQHCRQLAENMPQLRQMGIRVIGVGMGDKGLKGFLEGGYWSEDAEFVVDTDG